MTTNDPGPIIVADTGITHDAIVAMLTHGLEAFDFEIVSGVAKPGEILHDDLSTLAHHILGIAALAPRLIPGAKPEEWVRDLVVAAVEKVGVDRP